MHLKLFVVIFNYYIVTGDDRRSINTSLVKKESHYVLTKYKLVYPDHFKVYIDEPKFSLIYAAYATKNTLMLSLYLCSKSITYRGYFMAARGYEFYLRVLKVSLTSERSEQVRDTFSTRR